MSRGGWSPHSGVHRLGMYGIATEGCGTEGSVDYSRGREGSPESAGGLFDGDGVRCERWGGGGLGGGGGRGGQLEEILRLFGWIWMSYLFWFGKCYVEETETETVSCCILDL
mmetsp:Transcript_32542/g.68758  ORF Transcript_32542/g.68758 Transcript_32542/m.68758 type:complete len:112 (-) Transcript_32542:313-648(-)